MHLPIFASVAAVGAGLAVAIDGTAGDSLLGPTATGLTIAIPVAVCLMGLSGLYVRAGISRWQWLGVTATALLVMSAAATSAPVLVIGLLLVVFIAIKLARQVRGDPNST
jgi:hypothetical protein